MKENSCLYSWSVARLNYLSPFVMARSKGGGILSTILLSHVLILATPMQQSYGAPIVANRHNPKNLKYLKTLKTAKTINININII